MQYSFPQKQEKCHFSTDCTKKMKTGEKIARKVLILLHFWLSKKVINLFAPLSLSSAFRRRT